MTPKTSAAKKVKLACYERVAISQLLTTYQEGNFITFKILGDLRRKVGFTSDEIIGFNLQEADGHVTWNEKGNTPIEFKMNEGEVKLIRDQLIALDKAEKLTNLYLSIYELFV